MKEAYAITGFLPTAVASKLSDRAVESVDVLIDKKSDTVVRVAIGAADAPLTKLT